MRESLASYTTCSSVFPINRVSYIKKYFKVYIYTTVCTYLRVCCQKAKIDLTNYCRKFQYQLAKIIDSAGKVLKKAGMKTKSYHATKIIVNNG